MRVPILDLKSQYINMKEEINESIIEVLEKCQFILGPQVKKIEENISKLCNVKFGIGVANGTDALELTLKALNIGAGDEVITTPFTFFASAEVIAKLGAVPVFVDIERGTYLIDADRIEEKITKNTKAIIPVHLFGQACNMKRIMDIAKKYNLHVVEDSCQAIGSEFEGKKVSSFGDAGCFSFFPTKNLGGYGDGGMIVTDDESLNENIRLLRQHGSNVKYHHSIIGYNSRLDEIQAAILNVKSKYLSDWNQKRRNHAYRYNKYLADIVKTPEEAKDYKQYHVYHQYTIEVEKRDELAKFLKDNEIGTSVYYPVPLHLQEAFKELGYKNGDMPNAEEACNKVISLPISPEMTIEEQDYVIEKVREFSNKCKM
ncbi:MAG: DegT/DnrJ/EryC1/StrS family aminotransferase [Deltaproteobacteria bacterium]